MSNIAPMDAEAASLSSETVKNAVQHPPRCTPDTVILLRRLLSTSGKQSDGKYKSNKAESRPPSSKSTRSAKTRGPAKTPVYRGSTSDDDTPCLSKHAKLALATDVFNIASKSISGCIERPEPLGSRTVSTPKKKTKDGCRPAQKSPLQPTSPNRKIVRSPAKVKGTEECSRNQDTAASRVTSVADCARVSLSCLRVLRNEENDHSSLNIQLEQGLCVLAGKFIAAGLSDMAAEELRKLKGRIVDVSGKGGNKRTQEKEHVSQGSESLEELIRIELVPSSVDLLQLVMSFQYRVLSLISAERQPSTTVNRLPRALAVSNPFSPCNLILAAHTQGVIDGDKAAKQLQTLSRTILSLGTDASSSADSKPTSVKTRIKPVVTLSLQLLSLEIRCIHWRISGHRCNYEKELWVPLAQYFVAFARRSSTVRAADYDYLKEAFLQLQSTISANGHDSANTSLDSSLSTTFRTVAQLSHNAGRLEDAIKHCEMAVERLPPERHLQLALCRCKSANLFIESLPKKPLSRAASAIDEAAATLSAPLRGAESDIEELLIESARLKKAAMGTMGTLANAIPENSTERDGATAFRVSTSNYLISFVRLLNRYIVPSSSQSTDADRAPTSDRSQKFRNIVPAAVDSCISMGKLAISTGQPSWTAVEPVLSDCLSLLISLQDGEDAHAEPEMPNCKSNFVRLSNLYWSLYISEKEKGKAPEQLVQAVERSVIILQKLSSTEQSSGLMAIKLEKLAGLFSDIGQYSKANSTRAKSIRAHLDAGVLDSVESEFSKKHPFQVWRDPQRPVFSLGRVLHAYVRSRLKDSSKGAGAIYDNEAIHQEQRTILLEHQLTIMTGAPIAASELTLHVSSVVTRLLPLYPLDKFPIRRMRVILQVLRFMLENHNDMEDSFRETMVVEARKCLLCPAELFADSDLSHFREYTVSALRLALGFAAGDLTTETLNQVVESWVSMLQSCEGRESLEAKVDDVSAWMSQARAIVDYLDAQGLCKLKLRSLAVIRRALEYQTEHDFTMMVSCLSQTGLQYCRLGYSEQAHAFLSRAGALIKQNQHEFFPLARLTWLLAYAEHLLAVEKVDNS